MALLIKNGYKVYLGCQNRQAQTTVFGKKQVPEYDQEMPLAQETAHPRYHKKETQNTYSHKSS